MTNIENALIAKNIGHGARKNKYCTIVFGGTLSDRAKFLPASDTRLCIEAGGYQSLYDGHKSYFRQLGGFEDGFQALELLINATYNGQLGLSTDIPTSALLITNEDRDKGNFGRHLTRQSIVEKMKQAGISLNVLVSLTFTSLPTGNYTVGIANATTKRSFSLHTCDELIGDVQLSFKNSKYKQTTTMADYVRPALEQLGGSAWDINMFYRELAINHSANYCLIQKFADAFVDSQSSRTCVMCACNALLNAELCMRTIHPSACDEPKTRPALEKVRQ